MTRRPHRTSELALIIGFLVVIFAVPIAQTCMEISRGERVQFMDVFRYMPTARNLRQHEKTIEEKSWFQLHARPLVQGLLFETLHEAGAKAIVGREGWLFYRPDVRYVVEPDHLEIDRGDSRWVRPETRCTRRESVIKAIVRFRDQLKDRGIELVVMPMPGKPSIYPDKVTQRVVGKARNIYSPTLDLLDALKQTGVPVIDLFSAFQAFRLTNGTGNPRDNLYLDSDTHWTPTGAKLAAKTAAGKLREFGWVGQGTRNFQIATMNVKRIGDVLDMMQIPGAPDRFKPQTVECEQVSDPTLGLLLPTPSDRPGTYKYPSAKSPVLVLGDSFCRIYQFPEPQSLGEALERSAGSKSVKEAETTAKKLLPGSAGFISHLALALSTSVDAIVSDGGASTDVRKKLSMNPEILEGKKIVLWEFVERDINLGREGWMDVPLPAKLE